MPPGLADGLRLHAEDVGWSHGAGPTVSGDAGALLLALTGRAVALDHLAGDGVVTLRSRTSKSPAQGRRASATEMLSLPPWSQAQRTIASARDERFGSRPWR